MNQGRSGVVPVILMGLLAAGIMVLAGWDMDVGEKAMWRFAGGPEDALVAHAVPAGPVLGLATTSTRHAPLVRVETNGQPRATLASGQIWINVDIGDTVVVDARGHPEPVTILVSEALGMREPLPGRQETLYRSLLVLEIR